MIFFSECLFIKKDAAERHLSRKRRGHFVVRPAREPPNAGSLPRADGELFFGCSPVEYPLLEMHAPVVKLHLARAFIMIVFQLFWARNLEVAVAEQIQIICISATILEKEKLNA